MAKVYTGTGDAGQTSLYSGERVAKCCARVSACGTADELQASLGLARALVAHADVAEALREVQLLLVDAMAELATVGGRPRIGAKDVGALERAVDCYAERIAPQFSFQVPGDAAGSAALHVARTVARRCEREVAACIEQGDDLGNPLLLAFFNRVSDLCYVLARFEDEDPGR